ncbi:hypothetical protein GCM10007111_08190 [Virgibacillus kapii]|uniref:Uncharacterized protein n=2 Tax=Virgibacillus TaxID=84406 RepID=A0A024QCA3_9BACI|nr:hypothetical protein GCM10007111_08190 [Virgibacillus kapii]CDQ39556.1 hypothetical protein BN990_01861 [Virgibacillus massiliensis]
MFNFWTDVLKKDEEEFWKTSMRRFKATFDLHIRKKERMEQAQHEKQQHQALETLKSLK